MFFGAFLPTVAHEALALECSVLSWGLELLGILAGATWLRDGDGLVAPATAELLRLGRIGVVCVMPMFWTEGGIMTRAFSGRGSDLKTEGN